MLVLTGCGAKRGSPPRALPTVAPASCVAPLPLVFGTPMRASSRQGTDQLRASCVRGAAPECLFTVEVPARSELRVSLETNDFDGALALYDAAGSAGSPRELRCVDDVPNGDTHHSRLDFALPPGSYLLELRLGIQVPAQVPAQAPAQPRARAVTARPFRISSPISH